MVGILWRNLNAVCFSQSDCCVALASLVLWELGRGPVGLLFRFGCFGAVGFWGWFHLCIGFLNCEADSLLLPTRMCYLLSRLSKRSMDPLVILLAYGLSGIHFSVSVSLSLLVHLIELL